MSAGNNYTIVTVTATLPMLPLHDYYMNCIEMNTNAINKEESNHIDEQDSDEEDSNDNVCIDSIHSDHFLEIDQLISKSHNLNNIPTLKELCERKLCRSVNLKNSLEALVLADQFDCSVFLNYCEEFIRM